MGPRIQVVIIFGVKYQILDRTLVMSRGLYLSQGA